MLKPITLHPSSVLVGLGLAALVVVASGAAQSGGSGRPVPTELRVVGHIPASWWTSFYVNAGDPAHQSYTVPADKYFVATLTSGYGELRVNGLYSDTDLSVLDASAQGIDRSGTRVVFPPGSVLAMHPSSNGWYRFWGYLEPVN